MKSFTINIPTPSDLNALVERGQQRLAHAKLDRAVRKARRAEAKAEFERMVRELAKRAE